MGILLLRLASDGACQRTLYRASAANASKKETRLLVEAAGVSGCRCLGGLDYLPTK